MHQRWPVLLGLLLSLAAMVAGLAMGPDPIEGLRLAARWTARAGFPILILTYSASSLARLWPGAMTRALVQQRRWWGLGFAASHTVHLIALVTYLNLSGETRPLPVYLIGGGGYVLLYLMVLTSSDAAMRALGRNWKRLHTLGIHWLWFVFFASYLGRAMKPDTMAFGLTGTMIALAALGLRIAARRKRRGNSALAT